MPGLAFARAALAALFVAVSAAPSAAQDVTLTSRDGSVVLNGTLLQYDGEFFRIRTDFGDMTVAGDSVRCTGPGCPDPGAFAARVAISGSRTIGETLMPAVIEAYAAERGYRVTKTVLDDTHFIYALTEISGAPVAEIALRASSTAEGIADLLAREADVALALRPVTAQEAAMVAEAGVGDLSRPERSQILGLDALVAAVSPGNPVTALSKAELAAIFSGQVTNWSAFGGPDAPIAAYLREPGSGLAALFEARVLAPRGARLGPAVQRLTSNAGLSDRAAADPFAIAITSYSELGNARALELRGDCGFAIAPTRAAIKSEDYPLTARLLMYTPARRPPRFLREFLGFLAGEEAQALLPRAGLVGQTIETVPLDREGRRLTNAIAAAGEDVTLDDLKRLVATLDGAERLTAGFRFEDGSVTLDQRSQANLRLLARRIEAGAYDGKELIFAGYSDSVGGPEVNRRLSLDRAAAARAAVQAAAGNGDLTRLSFRAVGFGELAPLACDDTDWGRQINRRVEVWVRDQR
jgi:phosphate transport system substrate-binding protein